MAKVDPLIAEIERRRLERGWSVKQLVDMAGVSIWPYYAALRGDGGMRVHTLRCLAGALGLTLRLSPVRPDDKPLTPPAPDPDTPEAQAERRRALTEAMRPVKT